jgi:hypothetical protein
MRNILAMVYCGVGSTARCVNTGGIFKEERWRGGKKGNERRRGPKEREEG